MAEPLKNRYGPEVASVIAQQIQRVYPSFDQTAFLRDALAGYEALELMPRGHHLCATLRQHLPPRFADAVEILLASLGQKLGDAHSFGMAPFHYLPHTFFISTYGPSSIQAGNDDFDLCMRAQYELTQRFTAEFSMRAFLAHFPQQTLARLAQWTKDPSEHVRRLVSESTRPRLPWAARLPAFQHDPKPVIALLEQLKDDPSKYVQRSVANNLNDIGKDNPAIFYDTLARWQQDWRQLPPSDRHGERDWVIRHALRTAIKRGEGQAFALSGCHPAPEIGISDSTISPNSVQEGDEIDIRCTLTNLSQQPCTVVVDLAIDYVKAQGKFSRKVFKLKRLTLDSKEQCVLGKRISLRSMTTRKHYPGTHPVSVLINGVTHPLGEFVLHAKFINQA